MSKTKIKTLAALVRLDLEKAKRRFKKVGNYEIDIWHDEPKSALFFNEGIEVLIIETTRFSLPHEKPDESSHCISAINLYSPDYCKRINRDFSPYEGEILGDVSFSDSRDEVRSKLGKPSYSLDKTSRYDEYPLTEDTAFQFYYPKDLASTMICSIVLSAALARAMGFRK